jgi:hypothetical protein
MDMDARKPARTGEYIVEVIGEDGLKHHVGPFKRREEAEDWIAQNPEDSAAADRLGKTGRPKKKSKSRRTRSND